MSLATSVVIPCYNSQEYLLEALASVRAQTSPVREIIVVDDGSTVPVVAPRNWDGPPVDIIRIPNQGPATARNQGLKRAAGEFVALLDADDKWDPRMIEAQEAALAADPAAIASYSRCAKGPGLFSFGPYPPKNVNDSEFLLMLWYHPFFPPAAVMFRRAAIDKIGVFDESLRGPEDGEYWFRLLTLGRFAQVREPLCLYRQHPGQFTTSPYRKTIAGKRARIVMIERYGARLVQAGLPEDKLWDAYRSEILLTYYRRQFVAARPLLWDYWKDHPGDVEILFRWCLTWLPERLVTRLRGTLPLSSQLSHADDDQQALEAWWRQEVERLSLVATRLQRGAGRDPIGRIGVG